MSTAERLAKIHELSTAMANCPCLLCFDCTERLGEIQELSDEQTINSRSAAQSSGRGLY